MNTDHMNISFAALAARLKVVEGDNALMQAALDALKPDWRTPKGASGTMTPVEDEIIGMVVASGNFANVREKPQYPSPIKGEIPHFIQNTEMQYDVYGFEDDADGRINVATGRPYIWYKLFSGFVREDVVTFTPDQPAPAAPIHAALWPSPVGKYTVTNTHENHRDHDGHDYACPLGTPIQAGPNGAYVAKAFACTVCNPNGDGPNSLNDPNKAYGYGSNVILRYAYDVLPAGLKAAIPNGAYVYAIHAHMSKVAVSQGQSLEPYQVIGEVGATGNVYSIGGGSPSHLHYALRWSTHPDASWSGMNNNRINPSLLVKA